MASVLFSPITLRGLTLPNRVVVSPMCQYNSDNGSANDWHLMHLGNLSLGCAGLVMCEMTDVNPQGRISPKCAGMWSDDNEAALKRVHDFCRTYGVAKLGVQLAHAGRKGPTTPPAAGGKPILTKDGRRLDAGGAVGHSLRHRLAGAARHDQGRHQALHRRIRRRGQARRPHRLRRDRTARRARLSRATSSCRRSPTSAPTNMAARPKTACALPSRCTRRCARYGRSSKPLGMRVSATDWVDGGWTPEETVHAGQGAEKARHGLYGRVDAAGSIRSRRFRWRPATRCRSPKR